MAFTGKATYTAGDGHGPLVGAMDSAGQAVGGVVGQLDGAVVTAVVRGDGQHRPEYLLLEDRVVRGDVRNDGRCHEESAVQTLWHAAAGGDSHSTAAGAGTTVGARVEATAVAPACGVTLSVATTPVGAVSVPLSCDMTSSFLQERKSE